MTNRLERLLPSRFMRFALMGGLAAGVNIGSRIGLSFMLSYQIAIVIAYLIGMTTAYVLMKMFVFEESNRSNASEYTRFGLVNLIALVQVWGVSLILARWLLPAIGIYEHQEIIAHVIGVMSPIVTSYAAHRYFTFS